MNKPKLLMLINEFPPTGQSGVQRALKFLKYACREGWEVHVVTPRRPVRRETDVSLLEEIPPAAIIHRTPNPSFRSRNVSRVTSTRFADTMPRNVFKRWFWSCAKFLNDLVFPVDKQIGWLPFALPVAKRLIRKHQIANLFITAYPYSAFLIGLRLKKNFGDKLYWVADYRDVWQFAPLIDRYVLPFRLHRIERWDDLVLRNCDQAVFVTPHIRDLYLGKHSWLEAKSSVIANGFDEDDFLGLTPRRFDRPTICYMGRLDRNYGDPLPLLRAIRSLNLPELRFIHLGSCEARTLDQIRQGGFDFYSFIGYRPHREALTYACGADLNVILLNDDPSSEGVYTGKLFELLRSGKPILSIGPLKSVIKDLLEREHTGIHVFAGDEVKIAAALQELLVPASDWRMPAASVTCYSREVATRKLLALYTSPTAS